MRYWLLGLLAGLLIFSACSEEGTLGAGLLPNVNGVGVYQVDTSSVESTTLREDSLRTSNSSSNLVGCIYDPIFGLTTSSFVAQAALVTENINFGDTLTLDSVVLSLKYDYFYGDTSRDFSLEVYELNTKLSKDSVYFNTFNPSVSSTLLGSKQFKPRPLSAITSNEWLGGKDSVVTIPAAERIRLSDAFGQKILSESGKPGIANNANFWDFFKGFLVKSPNCPPSGEGCMLGFNLRNVNSVVSLYYKQGSSRKRFDFVLAPNGATANIYRSERNGSIESILGQVNPASGNSFMSGLAGYKTKLLFPYLDSLSRNNKILINKAELVLSPVEGLLPSLFTRPASLVILASDSTGANSLVADATESYLGGQFNEANRQYRFVITREIQRYLRGDRQYGLYLLPNISSVRAERLVIGNGTHVALKPKLVVTFTYLNKN